MSNLFVDDETILAREFVTGDQTATTAVKYLDLSTWFGDGPPPTIELDSTVEMYYLMVESATPAAAPTITSVTPGTAMRRIPANVTKRVKCERRYKFLAYSSNAGIVRVARVKGS
jgi:hypothetical protein